MEKKWYFNSLFQNDDIKYFIQTLEELTFMSYCVNINL